MKTFSFFFLLFFTSFLSATCLKILDHDIRLLDSKETVNLCEFDNKVILAVNVASRCGYTYQYESLQTLYEEYKNKGLVVLGFPSSDFFQEFSKEEEVKEFCKTTFGVNFPMFKRSHVTNGGKFGLRGYKPNSFFQSLIEVTDQEPSWNFNKYLISRSGEVLYFNQNIEPDSNILKEAIEKFVKIDK